MGHGEELVIADGSFPSTSTAAETVTGRLVELPGFSALAAIDLVCGLVPLDAFVPAGTLWMQADGKGEAPEPVHDGARAVIATHLPAGGGTASIQRREFHARAREAPAVVRCSEDRPFGCFIPRKGMVF